MFNFIKKFFSKSVSDNKTPSPVEQLVAGDRVRGIVTMTDSYGKQTHVYVTAEKMVGKWFKIINTPDNPQLMSAYCFDLRNNVIKEAHIEILERAGK